MGTPEYLFYALIAALIAPLPIGLYALFVIARLTQTLADVKSPESALARAQARGYVATIKGQLEALKSQQAQHPAVDPGGYDPWSEE